MNYKYVTTEPPVVVDCLMRDEPVLINPDKLRFCLLRQPSMEEIYEAIDECLLIRNDSHWEYLMEEIKGYAPSGMRGIRVPHPVIRLLSVQKGIGLAYVKSDNAVKNLLSVERVLDIPVLTIDMSMKQQQKIAILLKPTTKEDILSFYNEGERHDYLGYSTLSRLAQCSSNAQEFFGQLTDELFSGLEKKALEKKPHTAYRKARLMEFLGLSLNKGWILFPFVHKGSDLIEHLYLLHKNNVVYHCESRFVGANFVKFIKTVRENAPGDQGAKYEVFMRTLMQCSPYRHLNQTSKELLLFFVRTIGDISRDKKISYRQQELRCPTFCNLLIKLFNASHANNNKTIDEIAIERRNRSDLTVHHSFQWLTDKNPTLDSWRKAFEEHIIDIEDSQFTERRKTCMTIGQFLLALDNPPKGPEYMPRQLINNFEDDSCTFRNFLVKNGSNDFGNRVLQLASTFFNWHIDRLRSKHQGSPQEAPHYSNPIDMRRDRFETVYIAGSKRRAIQSEVMAMMREILVENDYEWPKNNFKYDYGDFTNYIDTRYERGVWCPSTTVLMYMLLSVPLRGMQGQLLDSGEGDDEVFDFTTKKMIPNPLVQRRKKIINQLPTQRKEGLIQVISSGMLGQSDIVGLWITTNKTSGSGYYIPWVSEELLQHLEYQCNWMRKYAPNPEPRGRVAANGLHTLPEKHTKNEDKFFCLFRDPCATRKGDPHAPVSKQKLNKFWGLLCAETQRRINANAKAGEERVVLVHDIEEAKPKAKYDIHSLRVSGITDLLDRGVPLNIVSEYVAGHATYIMTLWYDKPSPFRIREHLKRAQENVGDIDSAFPQFSPDELEENKKFLLSHPDYKNLYTGFDALKENGGLFLHRQSGICPGTRCQEGALDEDGKPKHVPVGDRGPSCPQCRFWLTGPAFILGQVIEGNQLIHKIRLKVHGLGDIREKILQAEDDRNMRQVNVLAGQADIVERQLNDMLTEWWHRMRFYDASVQMLDDYNEHRRNAASQQRGVENVQLITRATKSEIEYSFAESSDIELTHFLSTAAEFFPEFMNSEDTSRHDVENAIGRILTLSDNDMGKFYFKLTPEQRHTAANMTLALMLEAVGPEAAQQITDGDVELNNFPQLRSGVSSLLNETLNKTFTLPNHAGNAGRLIPVEVSSHG